MKINVESDGIHVKATNWKEEQVFKLLVRAVFLGEEGSDKLHLDTYKGQPAYVMTRDGMKYVGGEEREII